MVVSLTIPARINILGNPSDANEGDYATISAAVNLFAGARIQSDESLVLEMLQNRPGNGTAPSAGNVLERCAFSTAELPLPYDGQMDLMKAALNRLYAYSSEFREKIALQGFRFSAWSEVPRQSGLGGSTLFVLLGLAGMRAFYYLDPVFHNDYVLAELAQRAEARELKITCGFADRYVPLFGGLAYLDYRGKLFHREIGEEPFVTYERMDQAAPELPLAAITTGLQHKSGEVHSRMRPRYLEEHAEWTRAGGRKPPMIRFVEAIWETAWRGKIVLIRHDLPAFGELMNENHRLVNEMMAYCGFDDGAGWANNLLISTALENGALGAKLTGAGSGGSVFALTRPGEQRKLLSAWEVRAASAGLDQAAFFLPEISRQGLRVEWQ